MGPIDKIPDDTQLLIDAIQGVKDRLFKNIAIEKLKKNYKTIYDMRPVVLLAEYVSVQKKQSTLSFQCRQIISKVVQDAVSVYNIDKSKSKP